MTESKTKGSSDAIEREIVELDRGYKDALAIACDEPNEAERLPRIWQLRFLRLASRRESLRGRAIEAAVEETLEIYKIDIKETRDKLRRAHDVTVRAHAKLASGSNERQSLKAELGALRDLATSRAERIRTLERRIELVAVVAPLVGIILGWLLP